jgi:hypothetical protein
MVGDRAQPLPALSPRRRVTLHGCRKSRHPCSLRSIRVIERNGGALQETKALGPIGPLKRYYSICLS